MRTAVFMRSNSLVQKYSVDDIGFVSSQRTNLHHVVASIPPDIKPLQSAVDQAVVDLRSPTPIPRSEREPQGISFSRTNASGFSGRHKSNSARGLHTHHNPLVGLVRTTSRNRIYAAHKASRTASRQWTH